MKILKVLKFLNIIFRIRMYFVKRRSLNGMKRFIDSYIKYYETVDLTPEMQKLKEDNITHLLQEKCNLESSIDRYVYKYTHNID